MRIHLDGGGDGEALVAGMHFAQRFASHRVRHHFWEANFVPGHKALCATDHGLPGPEEGSSPFVKRLNNASRKDQGRHEVRRHAVKYRVEQNQAASMTEQDSFPPRELTVNLSNQRGKGV